MSQVTGYAHSPHDFEPVVVETIWGMINAASKKAPASTIALLDIMQKVHTQTRIDFSAIGTLLSDYQSVTSISESDHKHQDTSIS
ncbi:hypothetical protein [Bombiscardovia coagulans]|uniref:Uncharacterized protein n=1 Tax=Bombiscardovia coagulans TaxID=686666 RepID=A0A261EPK0_9BIFI|nr:hypothetical protein [Bombiscardovia coagulans]OZG48779.1 hypothetical protein BOCO_1266 [Bombiscardovia coagulans]